MSLFIFHRVYLIGKNVSNKIDEIVVVAVAVVVVVVVAYIFRNFNQHIYKLQ